MSDINWKEVTAETRYETDATYLLDSGEDFLELGIFCLDEEEGGKHWYIENEIYEFDDIKINRYAKCRSGKNK